MSEAGVHTLVMSRATTPSDVGAGTLLSMAQIEVLAPVSESSLPTILGLIIAVQVVAAVFAWLIGQRFVGHLASMLDTRRSILLALWFYSVIAVWGYILRSTIEFWFLAWMVAMVQGGSQALSRSLYAALSPASKSGEFFGLFGVMEKFSAFIGPLIFALAAVTFGSSRPAVLALIAFFILGGYLLTRVNVDAGRQVAQADDAALMGGS